MLYCQCKNKFPVNFWRGEWSSLPYKTFSTFFPIFHYGILVAMVARGRGHWQQPRPIHRQDQPISSIHSLLFGGAIGHCNCANICSRDQHQWMAQNGQAQSCWHPPNCAPSSFPQLRAFFGLQIYDTPEWMKGMDSFDSFGWILFTHSSGGQKIQANWWHLLLDGFSVIAEVKALGWHLKIR